MSSTNISLDSNSAQEMKEVQRPNSAPFEKAAFVITNVLVESPETNQETQLPISTNSDEFPNTPDKMR